MPSQQLAWSGSVAIAAGIHAPALPGRSTGLHHAPRVDLAQQRAVVHRSRQNRCPPLCNSIIPSAQSMNPRCAPARPRFGISGPHPPLPRTVAQRREAGPRGPGFHYTTVQSISRRARHSLRPTATATARNDSTRSAKRDGFSDYAHPTTRFVRPRVHLDDQPVRARSNRCRGTG